MPDRQLLVLCLEKLFPPIRRCWPVLSLAAQGVVAFGFNSFSNVDFAVLATTNLALPLGQWSILGEAIQNLPGQYQFTDAAATNYPQQFYRVVSLATSAYTADGTLTGLLAGDTVTLQDNRTVEGDCYRH